MADEVGLQRIAETEAAGLHTPAVNDEMCVRVVVRDGIPEWWCKVCQCWHPITCPDGDR